MASSSPCPGGPELLPQAGSVWAGYLPALGPHLSPGGDAGSEGPDGARGSSTPPPHYYRSQSPAHTYLIKQTECRLSIHPSSIRPFIHSFIVYVMSLSTYYVPSAILDSGDTAMSKKDKALALEGLTCSCSER